MAKAFLLRWGTQNDFDSIKLQTRELGVAIDTTKLYLGTDDANVHIPNEQFVSSMIASGLTQYKPAYGSTQDLQTTQKNGMLGYNVDTKRLRYKTPTGAVIPLANTSDLPTKEPTVVTVAAANIDTADNNSVTLTSFVRPTIIIFLNGILCTSSDSDAHKYTLNELNSTIKINGCAENDIISYF